MATNARLDACIADAATGLGLDPAHVREIVERVDKFRKTRKASATLDADVRAFAKDQAERTKIAAALLRKQAALNILLRDEVDQRLVNVGGRASRAIESMLVGDSAGAFGERDSANALRQSYDAAWLESLGAELTKDFPHVLKLLKRPKDAKPLFDDVVREMHELREGGAPGKTGNHDARQLAKVFAKYYEMIRLESNRAGANIGKIDGYAGPQQYDEALMLKAGRERFVQRIMEELDHKRSLEGMTPDEVRQSISESFTTITTGRGLAVTAAEKGDHLGPANLARSMEAHRVWHFKDADAWIRIQDEFGRGNVLTALVEQQHRAARKVAAMKMLGPNPERFLQALLEDKSRGIRDGSISEKEFKALNVDISKGEGRIGRAFQEVMGESFSPESLRGSQWAANIRASENMAKLGGSVFSSMPDLASYGHTMRLQGKGVFSAYAASLRGLFNFRSPAESEQLRQILKVGYDSLLGAVHGRYTVSDGLTGKVGRAQQWFFKLNLQQAWDRNFRTSFMAMTSKGMHQQSHLAHDALPDSYRHFLGLHGIDAKRWEAIRASADAADTIMHPDKIASLPDAVVAPLVSGKVTPEKLDGARTDLELKLLGLLHDEATYAITTPDDRTRANLLRATRPGTLWGEAARFLMHMKTFSFAFQQKGLANRGAGRDWGSMATLIGMTWVLGYGALVMKNWKSNKEAPDAFNDDWTPNYKTLVASLLQGGGLGIYGDFLFSKTDRIGGDPLTDLLGPTASTLSGLGKMAWAVTGSPGRDLEKTAHALKSEALYFTLNNAPFINLFYVRAALDFAVLNWMQEKLTPGTFRRREKQLTKDYGTKYLVPPLDYGVPPALGFK